MEKVINSYEVMFIVDADLGEETINATVDKFTNLIAKNGEVVEVNVWGKRRLAYPINDKPEGYYVVATFKSNPEFPAELDRKFNINEKIMRSLIVKLEYEAVKHESPVVAEEESAPAVEEVAAPEATAEEAQAE